MYQQLDNEIFHVHTARCGHASDATDEAYVLKAIELGSERIVFTDHVPFPGDPFGSRMKMDEMKGYLESIQLLKLKYRDKIQVLCGFEAEYFPQYMEFYGHLKRNASIDILMLGQHMYMHGDGTYNFMDKDRSQEFEGLSRAIAEGLSTGFFDVLAHPDRMYMRYGKVDERVVDAIERVVNAAKENQVVLEKNYGSMYKEHNFGAEFWEYAGDAKYLYGYDAHSLEEIDTIAANLRKA